MSPFPSISVQCLHQLLTEPSDSERPLIQLIDVREPQELAIANLNHLGFRNYPLSQAPSWQDQIHMDLDPNQPTYVLCHHGMRSAQMTHWLQQQGFSQATNITGGIHAWSREVDPSVPMY